MYRIKDDSHRASGASLQSNGEGIPMQNSVLKLISIAGVLGIGTLVVLEVHKSLPKGGTSPEVLQADNLLDEPAELSQFPETEPSEFELAMTDNKRSVTANSPDSIGMDTDPFGDSFGSSFTEPDVDDSESVDVRVNANALTDGPSPFAPNQFAANDTRSTGESVPVRPVGFSEEPTITADSGTDDVTDFSAETFTPDADRVEDAEPAFSFDVAAPEPDPAGVPEGLSLPDEENPFDIANFPADSDPSGTDAADPSPAPG